jgi:hypothetical protein
VREGQIWQMTITQDGKVVKQASIRVEPFKEYDLSGIAGESKVVVIGDASKGASLMHFPTLKKMTFALYSIASRETDRCTFEFKNDHQRELQADIYKITSASSSTAKCTLRLMN